MVSITCEIRSALQELEDREQFCCISHFSDMFLCRNGLLIVSNPFTSYLLTVPSNKTALDKGG
jgi:hypothetical protein